MSYKTEFQANNIDLQSILDVVNALPEERTLADLLPTLSNPATAENIKSGYNAIDGSGKVLTGTLTLTSMLPTLTTPATAADVASGKEFVDSTGSVVSGSAEIPTLETPAGYVKIIIKTSGSGSGNSVVIDGVSYTGATTLTVPKGTSITSNGYYTYIDGEQKNSRAGTAYTFSANSHLDITIIKSLQSASRTVEIYQAFEEAAALMIGVAEVTSTQLTCPRAIGKNNIAIICNGDISSVSRYNVCGLYFSDAINFSQNCFGGTPTYDEGTMTFDNTTGIVQFSGATYSGSFYTGFTYYYIAW